MKGWLAFTSGGFLGIFSTSVFGYIQTTKFFVLVLFLAIVFYIIFAADEGRTSKQTSPGEK